MTPAAGKVGILSLTACATAAAETAGSGVGAVAESERVQPAAAAARDSAAPEEVLMLDYEKEKEARLAAGWLVRDPTTFDDGGFLAPEVLERARELIRERELERERIRRHPQHGKTLMAIEATLGLNRA